MSYGSVPGQPGGYGGPGYGAPGYGGPGYGGQPPASHLVWAILTTIFCCLPFGIVSIVFAAQVSSRWQAGDFAGAMEYSSKARTWAIVSAVVGVIAIIIIAIVDAAIYHHASSTQ